MKFDKEGPPSYALHTWTEVVINANIETAYHSLGVSDKSWAGPELSKAPLKISGEILKEQTHNRFISHDRTDRTSVSFA